MTDVIGSGLAMGFAGTLAMDIWALLLARIGVAPFPNWAMPGRWLGHLPGGRLFHPDIGGARPVPGELGLGWALHYGVGLIYGVIWMLIAGPDWLDAPTFPPLWTFALVTIAAGWFLLQPGMGLGWAASRTPRPWKARALGLAAHTVFALGMWGAALALA